MKTLKNERRTIPVRCRAFDENADGLHVFSVSLTPLDRPGLAAPAPGNPHEGFAG